MMLERATSQNVSALLTRTLRLKDPDVDVQIRRTSLGWLQLRLVTTCFQDKGIDEREQRVDDIIEDGRGCRSRIGIPTHFFAPTPSGVCP
jgi:hypothetical protein